MDPKACLDRLREAINAKDWDEARAALRDYQWWRIGGGFAPDLADWYLCECLQLLLLTRAQCPDCHELVGHGPFCATGEAERLAHGPLT
jgi:hypothetical protein